MCQKFLLLTILATCLCAGCKKKSPPPVTPRENESATQPAVVLLPVVQDGQWGYIDTDVKFVIPPQYQNAERFFENRAAVKSNDLWGFVDPTGRMVIRPQFEAVDQGGFSAGRIAVMLDGKWGLIDETGRTVLEPTFDSPLRFHEHLACFRQQNRFGYIDVNGQTVIEPKYTFAGPFSEGLAAVMTQGRRIGRRYRGGQWGFIEKNDKTAAIRIPPHYLAAGRFSEGLAWVQFPPSSSDTEQEDAPSSRGYIDALGQTVIRSNEFLTGRPFHEDRAAVRLRRTGLWGFIGKDDKSGQIVIEADFDQANDFHEGRAAVLSFGPNGVGVKWGYIDPDGEMVIPPRFDHAGDFQQGFAAVRVGEKLGYIDRDGRFLWPPAK